MLPTAAAINKRGRSKTGCETCRSRKVKCDEIRPKCKKCCRLNLLCAWPTAESQPLKARRRGAGSVKSRDKNWKPKNIFPALSPAMSNTTAPSASESSPIPGNSSGDSWIGSDEWWEPTEIDGENLDWLEVANDEIDTTTGDFELSGAELDNFEQFTPDASAEHPQSLMSGRLIFSLSRPLSDHHFIVPNALMLTPFEHQALHHYQTVFSTYRSTKDPKWSTHRMLLNYGSYDPMIMHFILAVSINDYSIRVSNESAYQGAQGHFEIASGLWIEEMKKEETSDHFLARMSSFFFLYLYMTKRRNATHYRLRSLSKNVVDFVKKHKLDVRCLGSTRSITLDEHSDNSNEMTSRQRSLLARLIMWTFDEDVKCGFQGSGGHLAQYLSENDARTKNIYDASRSVLENHWGSDYPDCQVFDDNENSVILEFLFAMMPLQQDINKLSSSPDEDTIELRSRIERKFTVLEQNYSSVFRIAATRTMPRTRVLVNADYDLILFHSLTIYYFRSTIVDLKMETPSEVYAALKNLLSIVQKTFAFNGTELHERLQWPLFLAGIETEDMIYREWILSKLTSYRVLGALKSTLDSQRRTGQRLRMSEIRDILHEDEEVNLLAGQMAFLDAVSEL